MLFKIEAPGYRLSWTVVIIATAMFVSLTVVVLGSLWRARRNPARVGAQAMRGLPAEVLDWSGSEGHVFTHGERWQAHGTEALTARRGGRGGRYQGSDARGAAAISTNRQRRRCAMMFDYLSYLFLVVVVVMFLSAAIRILREYERGVVFTLGRFTGVKGPVSSSSFRSCSRW